MHLLSVTLPALFVGVALGQTCTNGFEGISNKEVCCVLGCGQCGGSGCSTLPGYTGDECCTDNISKKGPLCSETGAAPCYMGDELPGTPSPVAPVVPEPGAGLFCSNGFPGFENKNICCVEGCGQCGGSGCSTIPGYTGDECCTANIEANGELCSVKGAAPCIQDAEAPAVPETSAPVTPTPGPVAAAVPTPGPVAAAVPTPGPVAAAVPTPGPVAAVMATSAPVMATSAPVMASSAPVMATSAPVMATSAPVMETQSPVAEVVAFNCTGEAGILQEDVCCEASCGTCGGTGCSARGNGQFSCCTSNIREVGAYCSETGGAPCIIDPEPAPSPVPSFPCSGDAGVRKGDICCEASCGTCGGSGCHARGDGPESCCTRKIAETGPLCSESGVAPCIIEGYQNLGCYADMPDARIMKTMYTDAEAMTAAVCAEICGDSTYFGTQWGVECWCDLSEGLTYDAYNTSVCDFPCSGDPMEMCGGFDAMTVYVNV